MLHSAAATRNAAWASPSVPAASRTKKGSRSPSRRAGGGPAAASGALWEERLGGLGPPGPAVDGLWSLDARGRYALRLRDGRLLA